MPCANGEITVGSRVKTQWTRAEGGNGQWYTGTVTKVYASGRAAIRYDDGDRWTGDAKRWIYLVTRSALADRSGGPWAPPPLRPSQAEQAATQAAIQAAQRAAQKPPASVADVVVGMPVDESPTVPMAQGVPVVQDESPTVPMAHGVPVVQRATQPTTRHSQTAAQASGRGTWEEVLPFP